MTAKIKVYMCTTPIKQLVVKYKPKGQKPTTHFLSAIDYDSEDELADALMTLLFSYERLYYNAHSIYYHVPEGSHGLFVKSTLKNLRPKEIK